jgi:nicotinamidase-related amidase
MTAEKSSGTVDEPVEGISFELEPQKTCLVVIDMQYGAASRTEGLGKWRASQGISEEGKWRFDRIEQLITPNIQRLLDYFRKNSLPIVYTTVGAERADFTDVPLHMRTKFKQGDIRVGSPVHNILEELKPRPGEIVLNKPTMSAFPSTRIHEVLQELGVSYLVFTGVSTNFCVDATARNATDYGYLCTLVEDASGANREEWHNNTIDTWRRIFGKVASTEQLIAQLDAPVKAART